MNEQGEAALDRQMLRVEELVDTLEKLGNPVARATVQELMKTLLALHRNGLERVLEIIHGTVDSVETLAVLGSDNIVSNLLLLHGLHPVNVEVRLQQAIDQIGPMIRGHGGELEIVGVVGNKVRVRLLGKCSLSAEALEHLLEEAVNTYAPDIQIIELEDQSRSQVIRIPLPLV